MECCNSTYGEEADVIEDSSLIFKRHTLSDSLLHPWDLFTRTVCQYAPRVNSDPSDINNAFSAIAKIIGQKVGASLIFGLPKYFLPYALL
jgi:hypothetical protein